MGCLSPFLFIYALSDVNEIFIDLKTVSLILYADDVVLYGDDFNELKIALRPDYLETRKFKLILGKCKVMKFTKKLRGTKKDDGVVYIIIKFESRGLNFSVKRRSTAFELFDFGSVSFGELLY
jgi:hypothetical protein